jgi:hypothetical protein
VHGVINQVVQAQQLQQENENAAFGR